jgi:ribosome-binding factor A
MSSIRITRMEKELLRIINNVLVYKMNDERLQWVTITEVQLTPDLQYAKVFFSTLNDEIEPNECIQTLTKASGFIKKEIANAHILRRMPEIRFVYDDTGKRVRNLEEVLKDT